MATDAQRKKLTAFGSHPLREPALALLRRAIDEAGLDRDLRGVSWGATVCVDSRTVIRLNCGNVAQLDVRRDLSKRLDPTGKVYFITLAVVGSYLGIRGTPRGVAQGRGFLQHVENSEILYMPFDDWNSTILDEKRVASGFRAHAQAALRNLPNQNWHNPLLDSLLD